MDNKLGHKYRNISGVVKMKEGANTWKFDGGFPPKIYRNLCRRLGLSNNGSHTRVVDFKSFNDLNSKSIIQNIYLH